MLKTIKKLYEYNKPFYGVNCGSVGFLLNKFTSQRIIERINKAKPTMIYPLQIKAISKAKKINSLLAINELSILRQSKQASLIQIKINQKILIKKLIGDGILLSTPAGSTAYNLSVNGPILLLKKLAITPISPFRPRRWKGKVVTDRAQIFIKNLDPKKRPIAAVADNNEIRNIVSIKASVKKKIKFKLLFNRRRKFIKED